MILALAEWLRSAAIRLAGLGFSGPAWIELVIGVYRLGDWLDEAAS